MLEGAPGRRVAYKGRKPDPQPEAALTRNSISILSLVISVKENFFLDRPVPSLQVPKVPSAVQLDLDTSNV